MIRDARLEEITSVCKSGSKIYARAADINTMSEFDAKTGIRLRGNLDLEPEEILYLAWRQTQSPSLSDKQLKFLWRKQK